MNKQNYHLKMLEMIKEYCGEETKISEVDFEAVRENFLNGR